MRVSLVATVLNEGDSIRGLMDSILAQTRQPDEVVICDGGSSDGTVGILREYADRLALTIVERPGANISQGRNAAIAAAAHPIIAVTDAGVRLTPAWLERLVAPFESDESVQGVAGFFLPDPHTPFEVAMGATVLPALSDINPRHFMPSSRSAAFRREALQAAGGYPEWLDFCEDLILDFRLAAQYGPFIFAPDAVAYFRPRPTLQAFIRQYYLYARGDGKARLFFRRHLIRYATYFAVLPAIVLAAVLINPLWLLLLLAGGLYMVAAPYRRLVTQWQGLSLRQKISAALWVPVIRVAGDLAKMAGYPVGVLWRWRHRPPRALPAQPGRFQVVDERLERIDGVLTDRLIAAGAHGWPRALAIGLTHTADVLVFLIGLAVLYLLGGPFWRWRVIALVSADLLTFLVMQLIKVLTRRRRPEGIFGKLYRRLNPYSFPSGHAARGGAMAMMGLLLGPWWFGLALLAWGVLVAITRVMLSLHYVSDVVAGLLFGGGMALAMVLLVLA